MLHCFRQEPIQLGLRDHEPAKTLERPQVATANRPPKRVIAYAARGRRFRYRKRFPESLHENL
jgi:hypothetical protein